MIYFGHKGKRKPQKINPKGSETTMKNLLFSRNRQERQETAEETQVVYIEVLHKWNGERFYLAETVSTEVSPDSLLSEFWNANGFENHLHDTVVCTVLR